MDSANVHGENGFFSGLLEHDDFRSIHWLVIASEAKQSSGAAVMDCFVASLLAMTMD